MFSPIFEVVDPKVKDILKVQIPSFNLVPAGLSYARSEASLPFEDLVRTSSPPVMAASDFPGTPIVAYSKVGDEGLPSTPLGPTNTVVLLDSSSLHGSNLHVATANSGVRSKMLPSLGVLPVASPSMAVPSSK